MFGSPRIAKSLVSKRCGAPRIAKSFVSKRLAHLGSPNHLFQNVWRTSDAECDRGKTIPNHPETNAMPGGRLGSVLACWFVGKPGFWKMLVNSGFWALGGSDSDSARKIIPRDAIPRSVGGFVGRGLYRSYIGPV